MDAGWYGADTKPSKNEFEGDWWLRTGDWEASPFIHRNDLKDVADAVHKVCHWICFVHFTLFLMRPCPCINKKSELARKITMNILDLK